MWIENLSDRSLESFTGNVAKWYNKLQCQIFLVTLMLKYPVFLT